MAWAPCKTNHVWEPIPKWQGRYKCAVCFTLGYHKLVIASDANFPTGLHGKHERQILPYLCPKCHGPTTKRDNQCLVCRKPVAEWKWDAKHNLIKDRIRVARLEWVERKWVLSLRGKMEKTIVASLAEGKKAAEVALGLFEDPAHDDDT